MNWLIDFLSFYLFIEGVAFCSTVSVSCKRKQEKSDYCKNGLLLRKLLVRMHVSMLMLFFKLIITNVICNMPICKIGQLIKLSFTKISIIGIQNCTVQILIPNNLNFCKGQNIDTFVVWNRIFLIWN